MDRSAAPVGKNCQMASLGASVATTAIPTDSRLPSTTPGDSVMPQRSCFACSSFAAERNGASCDMCSSPLDHSRDELTLERRPCGGRSPEDDEARLLVLRSGG